MINKVIEGSRRLDRESKSHHPFNRDDRPLITSSLIYSFLSLSHEGSSSRLSKTAVVLFNRSGSGILRSGMRMTGILAALAARIPFSLSSMMRHSLGFRFNFLTHRLNTSGSGFPCVKSEPSVMASKTSCIP